MYKASEVEFISRKNAYHASDNRIYIKRDNVKIIRVVQGFHDLIVDSKKIFLFEYK